MEPAEGILAGAGIVGSAYGAYQAQRAGEEANATNAAINERQMSFNRDMMFNTREHDALMSNTAWQRGVADMKKAGINPMAAYQSAAASTPSGSAANAGSLRGAEVVPSFMGKFLSSALEVVQGLTEASKNLATTKNIGVDTQVKRRQEDNVVANTELTYQEALHNTMLNRMLEAEMPSIRARSFTDRNRMAAEMKSPRIYGNMDAILRRMGFVGTAVKAALAYRFLKGRSRFDEN